MALSIYLYCTLPFVLFADDDLRFERSEPHYFLYYAHPNIHIYMTRVLSCVIIIVYVFIFCVSLIIDQNQNQSTQTRAKDKNIYTRLRGKRVKERHINQHSLL